MCAIKRFQGIAAQNLTMQNLCPKVNIESMGHDWLVQNTSFDDVEQQTRSQKLSDVKRYMHELEKENNGNLSSTIYSNNCGMII